MNNSFKHGLKQYFNFSRKDRNAIIVICLMILLIVIANNIVKNTMPELSDDVEMKKMIEELEKFSAHDEDYIISNKRLFVFNPNTISYEKLDSLALPVFVKENIVKYRDAGGVFSRTEDLKKIYGMNDSIYNVILEYISLDKINAEIINISEKPKNISETTGSFDPNEATFSVLKRFGFNNFQINNMIKYRESGGIFQSESDLLKIYGIDSVFYKSIQDKISISTKEKLNKNEISKVEIQTIELNRADSAQLTKLNGIGPVFASRILKYRDLLGGYYAKNQLLEVYDFPTETFLKIENNIFVDTTLVKKIRVNFAEYSQLLKHPYLNKFQVESILKKRQNDGSFNSKSEIRSIREIDSLTYVKIQPYITCR